MHRLIKTLLLVLAIFLIFFVAVKQIDHSGKEKIEIYIHPGNLYSFQFKGLTEEAIYSGERKTGVRLKGRDNQFIMVLCGKKRFFWQASVAEGENWKIGMSLGNDIVVFLPKDFGQYCIEVIVRVNKSSGEEFINEHFKRLLETIEYPNSGKKILSEQEAGKLLKQVIIHLGVKSEVFLFMLNVLKH